MLNDPAFQAKLTCDQLKTLEQEGMKLLFVSRIEECWGTSSTSDEDDALLVVYVNSPYALVYDELVHDLDSVFKVNRKCQVSEHETVQLCELKAFVKRTIKGSPSYVHAFKNTLDPVTSSKLLYMSNLWKPVRAKVVQLERELCGSGYLHSTLNIALQVMMKALGMCQQNLHKAGKDPLDMNDCTESGTCDSMFVPLELASVRMSRIVQTAVDSVLVVADDASKADVAETHQVFQTTIQSIIENFKVDKEFRQQSKKDIAQAFTQLTKELNVTHKRFLDRKERTQLVHILEQIVRDFRNDTFKDWANAFSGSLAPFEPIPITTNSNSTHQVDRSQLTNILSQSGMTIVDVNDIDYLTQSGSWMYGLDVSTSDCDFHVVYSIPPMHLHCINSPKLHFEIHPSTKSFGSDKSGTVEYSGREMVAFVLDIVRGSIPNFEHLFNTRNKYHGVLWESLCAIRSQFITRNLLTHYFGLVKDRLSRLDKFRDPEDSSNTLMEKNHLQIRKLLYQCFHKLFDVERMLHGEEPHVFLRAKEREFVLKIRKPENSNVAELESFENMAREKLDALQSVFDSSETSLPNTVSRELLTSWVMKVREYGNYCLYKQRATSSVDVTTSVADGVHVTTSVADGVHATTSVADGVDATTSVVDEPVATTLDTSPQLSQPKTSDSSNPQLSATPRNNATNSTNNPHQPDSLPDSKYIETCLRQCENDYGIRIVYAAERSSRVFGHSVPNSDHDITAIFVGSLSSYFSLAPIKSTYRRQFDSTTEGQSRDVDISLWEMKHCFGMLVGHNPSCFEAFRSPLVYRSDGNWVADVQRSINEHFDATKLATSWYHHATSNFQTYIKRPDSAKVERKRYIHVVRAVLNCLWFEQKYLPSCSASTTVDWPNLNWLELQKTLMPPSEFPLPDLDLLRNEPRGRLPEVDNWIQNQFARLKNVIALAGTSNSHSKTKLELSMEWDSLLVSSITECLGLTGVDLE